VQELPTRGTLVAHNDGNHLKRTNAALHSSVPHTTKQTVPHAPQHEGDVEGVRGLLVLVSIQGVLPPAQLLIPRLINGNGSDGGCQWHIRAQKKELHLPIALHSYVHDAAK
jgi:hypothetical protein